jgi:hypothetical protein
MMVAMLEMLVDFLFLYSFMVMASERLLHAIL